MAYRQNYLSNNYADNNQKLGYSSVSKNYGGYNQGYSQRNIAQDHNLGQIEFMLENQRKKFKQAKEKFDYDLDNERKTRIQFENKLIKIKDQFSRKEVQMSQLQFKLNNLIHQNQDIIIENERLKNQLARLQELYGGKIHELQNQLSMETKSFQQTTLQYNTQFEKFKKEGQDYVEQLTFEFERKVKNLQQRCKSAQNAKRDLALENKKLNDVLISNKLTFEEQLRDVKNRAREEEIKKSQAMTKGFEQKMKVLDEGRQSILRKNQQLLRALQDKDRMIQNLQAEQNEEIQKYRQDNAELQQQVNTLNYLVGKLKSEIAEKDIMLGRSTNDNDHELNSLRQQVQMKKQENIALNGTIRDLRQTLKDSQGEWERRRRQLIERCGILENDARKYKGEYERICEILKSKINQTINTVSYNKR